MTAPRCVLGRDADHASRVRSGTLGSEEAAAFDAHLAECVACARATRALGRARDAWRRAIDHDDAFALHAREQRLTSARKVPRLRGGRLGAVLLGAAAGALLVSAGVSLREEVSTRRPSPVAAPAAHEAHAGGTSSPLVAAPRLAPDPLAAVAPPREPVLAARACRACAVASPKGVTGDVAAGTVLTPEAGIGVARGSTLVLSWSFAGAEADVLDRVDVDGPAEVRAATGVAGGAPELLVTRGLARVTVTSARALRTDLARVTGRDAAFRVEVTSDRTRVTVLRGEVSVEALKGTRAARALSSGDRVDVLRDGVVTSPPLEVAPAARVSPPAQEKAAPDPWATSEEAMRRGDRAAAERALRDLLATHGASPVTERAALRLSELELARGDVASARIDLAMAMRAGDPSVAADAALLLARSEPSPRARAEVWRDYLAAAPPSPYREQGAIERARALLDAGDRTAAVDAVSALPAPQSLPDVVRAGLERLQKRLQERGGREETP